MKQYTKEDVLQLPMRQYRKVAETMAIQSTTQQKELSVSTLEGYQTLHPGDYLCIGIQQEMWPTRKAHFERDNVKVRDIGGGIAIYKSKMTRYATIINEPFSLLHKDDMMYSSEDGDVIVWNGLDGEDFSAWIVEKNIFLQTYEEI